MLVVSISPPIYTHTSVFTAADVKKNKKPNSLKPV